MRNYWAFIFFNYKNVKQMKHKAVAKTQKNK